MPSPISILSLSKYTDFRSNSESVRIEETVCDVNRQALSVRPKGGCSVSGNKTDVSTEKAWL